MSGQNTDIVEDTSNVAAGTFMPIVSLRQHYKIGAAVMLAILCIGLPIAWKKGGKLSYAVTASVYVSPRFVNILQDSKDEELSSYFMFVQQQARTIGRYDIVRDALKSLGERRSVWQAPGETDRQAIERLQASLVIKPLRDTYLITVDLEGGSADGLHEVLNAVIVTYLERAHRDEVFFAREQRLGILQKRSEELKKDIKESLAQQMELTKELGITAFADNGGGTYDQMLTEIRTTLASAQRRRVNAELMFAIYDVEHNKAAEAALKAATDEIVDKDFNLMGLKAGLRARHEKLMAQFVELKEAHPQYQQIKRELAELEEQTETAVTNLSNRVSSILVEQRRSELNIALQLESRLKQELDEALKKASWFSSHYNTGVQLGNNIRRLQKQLDAVENRISFLDLESQAPGFLRFETAARPPLYPTGGGRKKMVMMVGVVALLLGLLIPILMDMFDKRIRTAGQVHKLVGYKPLAALFDPSGQLAARRVLTDLMRRLALALYRECRQRPSSLLMLTSVKPQAGVTSLALQLAQEFEALGLRTIVVEVNPVKPDPRYLGNAGSKSLLDLIEQDIELSACISPSEGALPDRLAVGLPTSSHLYAYPRLQAVLDNIRTTYPVVILDAPPVLLSADTEYLAGIADITLLLVGALQVNPGELKRAVKILERARPKLISFIVTRLVIYNGGGYYASMVNEYDKAEQVAAQMIASQLHKNTTRP